MIIQPITKHVRIDIDERGNVQLNAHTSFHGIGQPNGARNTPMTAVEVMAVMTSIVADILKQMMATGVQQSEKQQTSNQTGDNGIRPA